MKNLIILSIFALTPFCLLAQKGDSLQLNNKSEAGITELSAFNEIHISAINLEVNLEQGQAYQIKTDDSNTNIKAIVEDSILYISSKENKEKVNISIWFLDISKIKADQIVNIKSNGKIKTQSLAVDIDGSSKVNLVLAVDHLETNIDGSCNLTLAGKANEHRLTIKGAGTINADNLITQKTIVDISGAGKASVNVSDEISGKISGAAELFFIGDPELNNIEVTGVAVFKGKGSQDNSNNKDTLNVKIGKYKFNIIEEDEIQKRNDVKKKKTIKYKSWQGIDIGLLGYVDNNMDFNLPTNYGFMELNPAKSISVGFNIHEQNFRIVRDYLKFATGIGFEINHYSFANNTRLLNNPDSFSGFIDPVSNFSKTKLKVSYITLPLLLEINTSMKEKRAFHISGGLVLGYNIGSKSKLVYINNGLKTKEKVSGNYHINPFKYSLTARLGFGKNYAIYGIYDLNSLFAKNKGPELYSYALGLSLLLN